MATGLAGQPFRSRRRVRLPATAMTSPAQPCSPTSSSLRCRPRSVSDISLWVYGAVLVALVLLGVGAWVMHLRGASW